MPTKNRSRERVSRREFLAGASAVTAAGAALAATPTATQAQTHAPSGARAAPPTEAQIAREQGAVPPYTAEETARYFVSDPGSDVMVDVLKLLDIDYVTTNAGSSFRGLHESILNYGGNTKPEIITCVHEEQAVAMAHGYAKVAGKPIAVAVHGTVGIQHAAMAVYNAWCDRVPMVIIAGNYLDGDQRRVLEWIHSAQDCIAPIRDYIKWDDTPTSLQSFNESLVRAHKIATTAPQGPVAIVADSVVQEAPAGAARDAIPRPSVTRPPRADDAALAEAARLLVAAENPVIVADRVARDQAGVEALVALAEFLMAPVVNRRGRMNFPSTHYLVAGGGAAAQADVILALESNETWGLVNTVPDHVEREPVRVARPNVKIITLGTNELFTRGNYQNFSRYYGADLAIAGDAQESLPALLEAVRSAAPRGFGATTKAREQRARDARVAQHEAALKNARYAWDSSPVSTARLTVEVWNAVREHDWALVSEPLFPWLHEFWEIERYYQYVGGSGGAGMGYGGPAAVGAALGHKRDQRLVVNIQKDGDFMYAPGSLWTAAHHKIPMLSVMHNNRAYHQELMHVQRMAARRRRGVDGSAKIGTTLEDPFIDYAALARSLGVWAAGPVEDPAKLAGVLREAVAVVASGVPALVDVVAQPR
jgi:thiamine pyrophosphate-dependent acetolactate synthase large subunit-like protein